jgi:hypothetical protein
VCEVAGFPGRRGCTESCAPRVEERLGEARHGPRARADVEGGRTSSVPSAGVIGVEQLLKVPSFGSVTGERIGFIVVRSGQACRERPVVGLFPQSLHARKAGRRVRVGAWAGQRGRGTARPTP